MQPDARLVEDVKHANQAGADLRRQSDALRFTAAQRAALAGERQIVETDITQKTEPRTNLFDDIARDFLLKIRQIQTGKKLVRAGDRERAKVHDR